MLNGTIALRVPLDVIKAKCVPYRRRGKPWHRARLLNLDDYRSLPPRERATWAGLIDWQT
jgi:hypothetical protein